MAADSNDFEFTSEEIPRTLDDRFRVQIPFRLQRVLDNSVEIFGDENAKRTPIKEDSKGNVACTLAKERIGCLSLWHRAAWVNKLEGDMSVIRGKVQSRKLEQRFEQVQLLGRLLSTRAEEVDLTFKGAPGARLLIPKRFRDFLGVEPNSAVMIVAAAYSIEIWNPTAWNEYLTATIPDFHKLLDELVH